jgi:4a-hydroxytetrahydrobiopterin dehydratase
MLMNKPSILSEFEITNFVQQYTQWACVDNTLQANFVFSNFDDAMQAVAGVADIARHHDHHPFWSNEYNKLSFILCTHECDNKITNLDATLAQAISEFIEGEVG